MIHSIFSHIICLSVTEYLVPTNNALYAGENLYFSTRIQLGCDIDHEPQFTVSVSLSLNNHQYAFSAYNSSMLLANWF